MRVIFTEMLIYMWIIFGYPITVDTSHCYWDNAKFETKQGFPIGGFVCIIPIPSQEKEKENENITY